MIFVPPQTSERQQSNEPLAVAVAVTPKGWGGGEAQAQHLLEGLRSRGHRCLAIGRADGEFLRRMKECGCAVAGFSGRGTSPWAIWQIRQELYRFQPDVLHLNDPPAITAGGLAAQGLGIPCRIAAKHTTFPIRWPARYRWFADRTLAVCEDVARVLRAAQIPASQIAVVYPGVVPEVWQAGSRDRGRATLGVSQNEMVLLTAAQLVELKGHRFLLEALPGVIRKFPQLILALAGDGPARAELEAQAARLGIANHIRFLGFRGDLPDLVKASDLFVMPSLAEGVCSVLMEVMLCGTPIVTTSVNGIPEVVGDQNTSGGSTAWLVPPRDSVALATSILEAISSPKLRSAQAERAQHRANQLFTAERMVENTLALYRSVLATKGRRAAA